MGQEPRGPQSPYFQKKESPPLRLTIEGIAYLLLRPVWLECSSFSFSISGLALSITRIFLSHELWQIKLKMEEELAGIAQSIALCEVN